MIATKLLQYPAVIFSNAIPRKSEADLYVDKYDSIR